MDPVSILALAGKAATVAKDAWDVSAQIYTFVQAMRKVDKTIEALSNEAKSLGDSCNMVHGRLEIIVKEHDRETLGISELWQCLDAQMSSCRTTIADLHDLVPTLTKKTMFNKFKKQVEMNIKSSDITEARDRIHAHTLSLQTVLICIGIEVSYLSPKRADQQLRTQLSELSAKAERLSKLLVNQAPMQDTQITVLSVSSKIISSGETLYEASVAGGSVVAVDSVKLDAVQGWLRHADFIDQRVEDDAVSAPSTSDELESTVPTSNAEDDFEDEFALETARHSVKLAEGMFKGQKWHETNEVLQETLQLVLELPRHQQKLFDMHEIRFMLAICSFYMDPTQAKDGLVKVVSTQPKDEVESLRVCTAGVCLAQTCVLNGDLDQARIVCDSARQARSRLLGKNDHYTHEAIALLARITHLQGKQARARVLSTMLPESAKGFLRQFESLSVAGNTMPPLTTHPDVNEESPNAPDSAVSVYSQLSDERSRSSADVAISPGSATQFRRVVEVKDGYNGLFPPVCRNETAHTRTWRKPDRPLRLWNGSEAVTVVEIYIDPFAISAMRGGMALLQQHKECIGTTYYDVRLAPKTFYQSGASDKVHMSSSWRPTALALAAATGQVEVLLWLLNRSLKGCTTALYAAVLNEQCDAACKLWDISLAVPGKWGDLDKHYHQFYILTQHDASMTKLRLRITEHMRRNINMPVKTSVR